MSRISSAFSPPGHRALIPYLTVGYPDLKSTLELVPILASEGCDLVELGIPFSDPLADGTTIQESSYRALKGGITPELCLEVASRLRREVDIPLVFMTYYNPVFSSGLESFCRASGQAGIDGLIIPDLPPEEGGELEDFGAREGIDIIYLLAPTSTPERMNLVAERSRGFIYLVSLTGVTGAREALPPELEGFIARVRRRTTKSLCVGFGISTPEQAYRVAQVADGVIVGSRLIQLIDQSPFMGVRDFIRGLRLSLDQVERGSDR